MSRVAHCINGSAVSGTSSRIQPVHDPATGYSDKNVLLASTSDVSTAVAAIDAGQAEGAEVVVDGRHCRQDKQGFDNGYYITLRTAPPSIHAPRQRRRAGPMVNAVMLNLLFQHWFKG